jgi:hypothetical protein
MEEGRDVTAEIWTVKLNVTDADSGDTVFHEERSVSALSSDVSRMASHFQNMVSDARSAARVARAEAQARAKEDAFLADLLFIGSS